MVVVVVVLCAGVACKKTKLRVPQQHRGSAAVCAPNPHAAHRPLMARKGSAACRADADCTAHPNGICVDHYIGQGDSEAECEYDQCMSDAQCTDGPCICGGSDAVNSCQGGLCRVDADCNGGYCSRSEDECNWGIEGWYCHTADDECTDDRDCGSDQFDDYCWFDPKQRHWACRHGRCQD